MFFPIAQMNSRKWAHLLVAGLALVGALAGCGGDDGEGTVSSMTKNQFMKKANAICSQVFDEIDRKYGKLSNESTEAELNEQAQEIVPPLVSRLVDRLRALGAPTGEEARVAPSSWDPEREPGVVARPSETKAPPVCSEDPQR